MNTLEIKTALITGQDGSFLSELLPSKGYRVHGISAAPPPSTPPASTTIYADPHDSEARLFLHYGDLSDATGLRCVIESIKPDEVYNIAAQSHVRVSFDQSENTASTKPSAA